MSAALLERKMGVGDFVSHNCQLRWANAAYADRQHLLIVYIAMFAAQRFSVNGWDGFSKNGWKCKLRRAMTIDLCREA